MSIAVLAQVHEETRRLAIAGSNLAVGDFRLKKLIGPLEISAQKAPVFGAVAKAIEKLVDGPEKDAAQSLLDLASLVIAILYTQGQTGCTDELRPVETKEMSLPTTQMSARLLKPLIEALTTKGSGRLEVIKEAYEQGAFNDLRLVNPSIAALDDVYSEIAEFVTEKILPQYGKAILPEIRDRISIQGKIGDARRLRLFHALDPVAARTKVLEAFEQGSKELKVAGLSCLGDSPEDLPHILEQTSAKQKEVRAVALGRLGKFTDPGAVDVLIAALGSANRELAVESVQVNASPVLWEKVFELGAEETAALLRIKDKAKIDRAAERLILLLGCFRGRSDSVTMAELSKVYDCRAELMKVKGTSLAGSDVVSLLRRLMLETRDKAILQRLVADREEMLEDDFYVTLAAAVVTENPKKVFDLYSPYMSGGSGKLKKANTDRRSLLHALTLSDEYSVAWSWRGSYAYVHIPKALEEPLSKASWDPRWLDLSIRENDLTGAIRFGNSRHAGLKKYLFEQLAIFQKKKDLEFPIVQIIRAMLQFEYTEAPNLLLETIEKYSQAKARHYYQTYWLLPLISKLPKSSLEDAESLIAKLPERVADEMLPHLRTLKAK